ncbi:zinc finger, RING/FYVE/PHD-type containing protein [Tanacetum coccineum]
MVTDHVEEDYREEEEMTSPRVSSWVGADGKTMHGVVMIDDGDVVVNPKNMCLLDDCNVCYQAWSTSQREHPICCVCCGHIYGVSCLKKWLLQSSSSGKCPQCNTLSAHKDVILLYASNVCVAAHQKASSIRHFPFTNKGFIEFKQYVRSRMVNAKKLLAVASKQLMDVIKQRGVAKDQHDTLSGHLDDLSAQIQKLEERAKILGQPVDALGPADALRLHADELKLQADALGQWGDALGQRANAFEWRTGVLTRRLNAYMASSDIFAPMFREYLAQQKNTRPCAAAPSDIKN